MENKYRTNREAYVSPEAEEIILMMSDIILYNEGGEEGGSHDWPDPINP